MRLGIIRISGFRGFATQVQLDLGADVVIVVAENGRGKTSLFDAVLWALTGAVRRIAKNDSELLSLFSGTGSMTVALDLHADLGAPIRVTRSFDGAETSVLVMDGDEKYTGAEAEARLVRALWPQGASSSSPHDNLYTALTRSVYLQQDLVKQFIEDEADHDRYEVLAELLGGGRLADLQLALERGKQSYANMTTRRDSALAPLRQRRDLLRAELDSIADLPPETSRELEELWSQISATAQGLVDDFDATPQLPDRDAVDGLLRQIQIQIQIANQKLQGFREVESLLKLEPTPLPTGPTSEEIRTLQERANDAMARVSGLRATELALLAERQAQDRREERLHELAQLAIEFLEGTCPVCGQAHDKDQTAKRLRNIQSESPAGELSALSQLRAEIEASELESRSISVQLSNAMEAAESLTLALSVRRSREAAAADQLSALGVEILSTGNNALAEIQELAGAIQARLASLYALLRQTEQVSLFSAQTEQLDSVGRIRAELEAAQAELDVAERAHALRKQASELASKLAPRLRQAGDLYVDSQIERLSPLLQRIFAAVDAHPVFNRTELVPGRSGRNGLLTTRIADRLGRHAIDKPLSILSSSQANAFAISLFLSLNLGIEPPLRTAILDDPLQSLDDVHLLGVVDVLRRVGARRQIVVSTHDSSFGRLLVRKLRPTDEMAPRSTRVITMSNWTEMGPSISSEDVAIDSRPLRLVG